MKPPIMIAIALVVGLGGGTFLGMKQAPPPTKAAADSATAKEHGDSSGAVHEGATMPSTPPDSAEPPPVKEDPQTVAVPVAPPSSTERIATVLTKLPPADIALLVEHMSDDDLVPVLKKLEMPTTAAVLALLPAARAKVLSKRLLAPAPAAKP